MHRDPGGRSARQVLVTGIGIETCLGSELRPFWDAVAAGRSGIAPIETFDVSNYPCKVAGQVDDHPEDFMSISERRRTSRYQQLALTSALRARANDISGDRSRIGVFVGSGGAGTPALYPHLEDMIRRGWKAMDRLTMLKTLPSAAAAAIAQTLGVTGPVLTVCTACAASTDAIGMAWRLIRNDEIDVAIVSGVDIAVVAPTVATFALLGVLSATPAEEAASASRPFDLDRNGMVPADGAATLILEAADRPGELLGEPFGEVLGAASTCDGYHPVAPRPDAVPAAAAISRALAGARVEPDEIALISAHGTATRLNDIAETEATKQALGEHAARVPITATKSVIGHACGASGAIEFVAMVAALQSQFAPPTVNLDTPDPECDLDYVPHRGRDLRGDVGVKLSFGFGGQNSAVVFRSSPTGAFAAA